MDKKAAVIYSVGCIAQIMSVCVIVSILRAVNVEISYNTASGIICIIIGGISSALWGIVVNIKYMNASVGKILKEFFSFRQGLKYYLLIAILMSVDFCPMLLGGKLVIKWYIPILIFLKSLAFGGIEEIGWRYTFQPAIRGSVNFVFSVLITFVLWSIWHCLFFYIDGSLLQIRFFGFFFGLLTTSFVLGMIYELTDSLWLCVFTHCFINTMSQVSLFQISSGSSELIPCITRIILIITSCILVSERNKRIHTEYNQGNAD